MGVTFTVLDITERKRVENELNAERKLLETVLRQLPEGVIIAEAPSGKLILGNEQAGKIWRHGFTALKHVDEYDSYKGFHPDGRPYRSKDWPLARTITTGETIERQEIKFQRSDGTFGWMSASSAPIHDEEGNVVAGVVTFSDTTRDKETEEMRRRYREELEREVGNRTAAIETQYKELQELNSLIKQLSWKTIDALETERKALSKEIHDSIAGTLAAIKMQLEAYLKQTAEGISFNPMPLEAIVGHLTGAIKETKHISMQLRSTTLDDFGLQPAIEEHIRHFRQFYPDIEVVARIDVENSGIPSKTETVLYRVVQEALNNIGKHSAATIVRLELKHLQKQVRLEISDNGCGFDLQPVLSERDSLTGFGIHSMRERVEICEGTFQIRSKPNQGTVIDISIPT
jgi:PAS domain S-box-containing protein